MKKLTNIVISEIEPQKDCMWIHKNEDGYVMKIFDNNGWTPLSNVSVTSDSGNNLVDSIGLLVINSTKNINVAGYSVPALTEEDVMNAYNAIAANRRGVVITDKDDTMHLLVNQAAIVGGDINIKTLFYDVLIITYTLTNNTVVVTYKDI